MAQFQQPADAQDPSLSATPAMLLDPLGPLILRRTANIIASNFAGPNELLHLLSHNLFYGCFSPGHPG